MKQEFKLTPAYCLYNGVAVLKQSSENITFLIENPENEKLKNSLTKAYRNYSLSGNNFWTMEDSGKNVSFVKGNRYELRKLVSGLYKEDSSISKNKIEKENEDLKKDAAAVLLLENIMGEAQKLGATDIHIEAGSIRYRVNGRLGNEIKIENEKSMELTRRIKVLSGMNVMECRQSQDGQFVYEGKNPVYIRTSTVCVVGHDKGSAYESMVLRLLDPARVPMEFNALGFNEVQIEKIKNLCSLKSGLVVICGPTGSGKSTTVASIMNYLAGKGNNELKIISLEDPPEYIIPGVTQVNMGENYSLSFKDSLKYVFRQDPDVIMIGEIRDEVTCETAIRASLTGHLVFATLHSENAAGTFMRLLDLGVNEKVLVSILKGVIVQEMNFFQNHTNLIADVALPDRSISQVLTKNLEAESIEELFLHSTNANEVLKKTIEVLSEKHKIPVKNETGRIKKLTPDVRKNKKTGRRIIYPKILNTSEIKTGSGK